MKTQTPLDQAKRIADAIVAELAGVCERIEIAGSIRRERPTVGDIEIIAIAREGRGGLFMQTQVNLLHERLAQIEHEGRLRRIRGADKFRQYEITKAAPMCMDLYMVTRETWGEQLLIRTGPAEFGKAVVTPTCKRGLLPNHLDFHEGRVQPVDRDLRSGMVRTRGVSLDTPEERDVFTAIELDWIEPADRDAWIEERQAKKGRR